MGNQGAHKAGGSSAERLDTSELKPGYDKYYQEIDAWNWDEVKKRCRDNPEEQDGEQVGMCFVGTVFNLTPSGKYYQPFACSNVKPCPRCKGAGTVHNPRGRPTRSERAQRRSRQISKLLVAQYGHYAEWPAKPKARVDKLRAQVEKYNKDITCPLCCGVGSYEAHLDEEWNKAFEDVASKHGCFVTGGEGDPCDLFVGYNMGPVEDLEEEESSLSRGD
jgi:hypothetical protein